MVSVAVLLFLLGESVSVAGTRKALLVLVGEYPESSGWNRLDSGNDRMIVEDMLLRSGFSSSDITVLIDNEATFSNIISALETLCGSVRKGDEVYVHFSCHGQQITDLDGDESLRNPRDRYDEAFVPYDAMISYGREGYHGEHHLLDDTLNSFLHRLSSSVGPKGTVLFVADACHSGDMGRDDYGEDEAEYGLPYRGVYDAFEIPLVPRKGTPSSYPVSWVEVSACKDFQTNFEVNVGGKLYGRLSYAVSRVFTPGMTPEELFSALSECYRTLPLPEGKRQTIAFECPQSKNKQKMFTR